MPRRLTRRAYARAIRVNNGIRFGTRVRELALPQTSDEGRMAKALDASAEMLLRSGIREVICAGEALSRELSARGIVPPSRLPLERAMLAKTALSVAALRRAHSVAIYAQRRTRELDDAVALLARKLRSVAVLLERGGEEYALFKRYELGLSIRTDAPALAASEVKLLYAEPQMPLGKGVAVGVVPRAEPGLEIVGALRYSFPAGIEGSVFPQAELASALVKTGALRADDIGIRKLEITNSIDNLRLSHYNAIWNAEIERNFARSKHERQGPK